jgi:hypothetical protein
MAYTFPKRRLSAFCPQDPHEGYIVKSHHEGASQSFPRGAPLAMVGGYLVVFVATGTAKIWGFSVTEGNNTTAGAKQVKYVPAVPEVYFRASFLGSSAANNVLAQTDFGGTFDLASNANLEGTGKPGWYLQDSASDAVGIIMDADPKESPPPDQDEHRSLAGDTNARLLCRLAAGASIWY